MQEEVVEHGVYVCCCALDRGDGTIDDGSNLLFSIEDGESFIVPYLPLFQPKQTKSEG